MRLPEFPWSKVPSHLPPEVGAWSEDRHVVTLCLPFPVRELKISNLTYYTNHSIFGHSILLGFKCKHLYRPLFIDRVWSNSYLLILHDISCLSKTPSHFIYHPLKIYNTTNPTTTTKLHTPIVPPKSRCT